MELFFRTLGQGPSLIILHGLFGMSDNWLTIARRIAEKHTVYIPDQRNHGQSAHDPEFNYRVLLEDLNELVNRQNLKQIRLIGHSMGGKVAMLYALEYPEQVDKLAIIDIAPKTYQRPMFRTFLKQLLAIDLRGLESRTQADQCLAEKIKEAPIRQFLLKNLYRDQSKSFQWRLNLLSLFNNIEAILNGDDIQGYWDHPALFVRGGQSDYILDSDLPRIKEIFRQAKLETIQKATHWVHADAPEQLCDALKNYLRAEK